MKKTTILAISGKPGLYKLIGKTKTGFIVEAIDGSHRRMPAFANDRITSIGDVTMYTDGDEVPLYEVLAAMGKIEGGNRCAIDFRKASDTVLADYMAKVLPNYDKERVHASHVRKLIQWYNILIGGGITDFEKDLAPTRGDNVADREEEKASEEGVTATDGEKA